MGGLDDLRARLLRETGDPTLDVVTGYGGALWLGLGLGLTPELRPGDEGDLERLEGWCVEAWGVVIRYAECL